MSVGTIEMEIQPNNEVQDNDDDSYNSSYKVKRNYLSMILVAYILTLLSPRSILWSQSQSKDVNNDLMYGTSINILVLAKLTTFTIILIIVFLNLQGSDPGILTPDVMARLDEVDDVTNSTTDIIDSNNEDEEEGRLEERLPLTKEESLPESQTLYSHTRRKYCNKCKIDPCRNPDEMYLCF